MANAALARQADQGNAVTHTSGGSPSGRRSPLRTLDGRELLLRLATADEAIELQRQALDGLRAQGIQVPEVMSRQRAAELVEPLPG